MRGTLTLIAAFGAVVIAVAIPRGWSVPGPGEAQTSAIYEYEVLPGLQPGFSSGAHSTYAPEDLRLSCGWHRVCGGTIGAAGDRDGLDVPRTATTTVYAAFRAVTRSAGLSAEVRRVSAPDATGCRRVEIEFLDATMTRVGQMSYVHTVPSVVTGNAVNVPLDDTGLAALALTPVGTVAAPAWTYNHVTPAIRTAAAGLGALGMRTTTIDDRRYNPGRKVRVFNIGTATAPVIMRQAALTAASDGENCPTSGEHVHHDSTTLDRNLGSGGGFPDRRGRLPAFCSDTWMFKLRSASGAAAPSTVAPCPTIASPIGLDTTPGDGQLAVSWNAPTIPANAGYTITGYEIRHKLSAASDWPEAWTPVSGTSHTLHGLANAAAYDVELRAVSSRFLRSAAVAESGTPMVPIGPTPTPGPATCMVNVMIEESGGTALDVDGVSVTGGGAGACGERDLAVVLTNVNYSFSSWTVAPATDLTSDCSTVSATCTLTFGTQSTSARTADVTATFSPKWCKVTGNVETLDTSGTVTTAAGGSVEANDSGSSSATVRCGQDVALQATANSGYVFRRWKLGPCADLANPCTVTTSGLSGGPPTAPGEVASTAVFQEISTTTPTCTVNSRAVGRGSVSGGDTVACGQSVTLEATPEDADYEVASWSGGGCTGTGSSCTVVTNSSMPSLTVTVTFGSKQCTVTSARIPSDGSGGTVSPGDTVDCGEPVTLTASPTLRYEVNWSHCSGTGTSCTVTTSGNNQHVTVTATFVAQCTLVVNGGTGDGTVDCGDTLTARASPPSANHEFVNWTGDGDCGTSNPCTVTVGTTGGPPGIVTMTANFRAPQCTLVVEAAPARGGAVSGDWTGDCGTRRTVRVTGVADNYRFGGWSGGGCGTGACSVLVGTTGGAPTTITVTATFVAQCTLVVNGGTGDGTVDCGDTLTARASPPSANHEFVNWTGDGDCGTSNPCTVTVGTAGGAPTSVTVTANFRVQQVPQPLTDFSYSPSLALVGSSPTLDPPDGAVGTLTYEASPSSRCTIVEATGALTLDLHGICTVEATAAATTTHLEGTARTTVTGGYGLTLSAGANGSLTPNPDETVYEFGDSVTISASADNGYVLAGWGGACSSLTRKDSSCRLTMIGHRFARATFEVDTAPVFALTQKGYHTTVGRRVSQLLPGATGGNGPLEYSLSGNLPPGHSFSAATRRVSGAAERSAAGNYYWSTLTATDADGDTDTLRIRIYIKDLFDLTVLVSPSGFGSASGAGEYNEDDEADITATDSVQNWAFVNWTGTGIDDADSSSTEVLMDADKTVTANFHYICNDVPAPPSCGARSQDDESEEPPTLTIDTTSQIVTGGTSIDVAATATAADDKIASYAWAGTGTFADPTAEDTTWTAPAAISSEQTYTLTLTAATDGGASASTSIEITVPAAESVEDNGDEMEATPATE